MTATHFPIPVPFYEYVSGQFRPFAEYDGPAALAEVPAGAQFWAPDDSPYIYLAYTGPKTGNLILEVHDHVQQISWVFDREDYSWVRLGADW